MEVGPDGQVWVPMVVSLAGHHLRHQRYALTGGSQCFAIAGGAAGAAVRLCAPGRGRVCRVHYQ